jgi:hypothetical protein
MGRDHLGKVSIDGSLKTDLKETGCEDVNWIQVVQDRVQWQALLK